MYFSEEYVSHQIKLEGLFEYKPFNNLYSKGQQCTVNNKYYARKNLQFTVFFSNVEKPLMGLALPVEKAKESHYLKDSLGKLLHF